ncbi:Outer membrane protein TolC [Cnuella takakiae]|uniref:Outer membrane protein TolC n=1 Tax=Cnuella takakiae TaxID=1302690 RepID=A0A1M5I2C4_9BACT|nr:TolC family protein [Cnuella takakiae]OLY91362.1 transporter [Cnuella takakiae]SHG22466.1 Outer membrane protein TolC [Cnuella takakiae]
MKHRNRGILLFALTLLLGALLPAAAQERKELSITEAIDLSIKNSHTLKGSQARIEQATAALREAVERKLPDASVAGSYVRLNNPNVSMKVKLGSGNSGGGSEERSGKISQAMYGMLNASLPIYAGGRIRYGIESSRFLAEATRLDAEQDREEVVGNTIEAFNNLAKARQAVALVQENLKDAQQRVQDFQKLEQNGLMARNDLLKAQLQTSNTELALLDAENNWKLANINMNLMLGLPDATEINPVVSSLKAGDNLLPLEDYVQHGLKNRKDLAALQLREQAATTGVKATKAEKLPSLALTGGMVDLHVPNLITVTNAVNLGVGVKYDIASLWKNKSKVQQAEARVREIKAGEEALNDGIHLQVAQAYQTYLSSRKKIEVYNNAVTQAEENFKVNQNKYNNGLATATDLLDADVARLQSRLNQAFAQSDAAVAYHQLLEAAGLLTANTNTK